MAQTVQLLRTLTNNPPGPLLPGELSLELGGETKLWAGAIAGNRLLASSDPIDAGSSAAGAAFLPLRGGVLSGSVTVQTAGAVMASVLAKSTAAQNGATVGVFGSAGGFGFSARSSNGIGIGWGPLNADGSPAYATNQEYMMWSGDRITVQRQFLINNVPMALLSGATLTLAADPATDMQAATRRYVDAVGAGIESQLGNYLPLIGGQLLGPLYLTSTPPAFDVEATNKAYVDLQDSILQEQIDLLADNLIFSGQIDVPGDNGTYTGASGIPNGPLPAPGPQFRGFYVIVNTGGSPPGISNIPPGTYARGDWIICDGSVWVEVHLGLTSVIAPEVALSPAIPNLGANVQTGLTWLEANKLNLEGGTMTGGLSFGATPMAGVSLTRHLMLHTAGLGIGATATQQRYVVPAGGVHQFYIGATMLMNIGGPAGGDVSINLPTYFYANAQVQPNFSLTLGQDPVGPMEAATRRYVDANTIASVVADGVSIIGNGTVGAPLECYTLDAGTY